MNRHNLPLARHAAMDMSATGWGNDCIQFKLSHKPGVVGLNCGGDNGINATLLTLTLLYMDFVCHKSEYLSSGPWPCWCCR